MGAGAVQHRSAQRSISSGIGDDDTLHPGEPAVFIAGGGEFHLHADSLAVAARLRLLVLQMLSAQVTGLIDLINHRGQRNREVILSGGGGGIPLLDQMGLLELQRIHALILRDVIHHHLHRKEGLGRSKSAVSAGGCGVGFQRTPMVQQSIESRIIGSSADVKTILQLGTDPAVLQRQQKLQILIPELEQQITSLLPLLSLLRKLKMEDRLPPEKLELLQKISNTYESARAEHRSASRELDEISSSQRSGEFSRVICLGTIHPGTVVTIGNASLTVTEAMKK